MDSQRRSHAQPTLVTYDEITGLGDEERAVDIVSLDFSKAFSTVSHEILKKKLVKYGLGEQVVSWIENWLNGQAQRVVMSGAKCIWRPVTSSVPQVSINTESSPIQYLH